jgi:hypothetical protein
MGTKKMIAEKIKKKINEDPNNAVEGKFRMLAIAATINNMRERRDIFLVAIKNLEPRLCTFFRSEGLDIFARCGQIGETGGPKKCTKPSEQEYTLSN